MYTDREIRRPWDPDEWLQQFLMPGESDFHALRRQVFRYTVQAVKTGHYELLTRTPAGETVVETLPLQLDPDLAARTVFYSEEQHPAVRNRYAGPDIEVLEADCLATAKQYTEAGLGKVAVLNMASRRNPGGGVFNGAGAQEEYCFRCSDYFRSLYQFVNFGKAYGVERRPESYPLDRNFGGVYSPNVTVFRDTEETGYAFLRHPWKTNFIAVAGLNRPSTVTVDGTLQIVPELVPALENKIRTILNIAVAQEVDVLILGALGCGAFRNPPAHVASLFRSLLHDDVYARAFRKVLFPIKKDHNSRHMSPSLYDIFKNILEV
ncbi:MAG: TIGR02452 family protein [Succiniclasticum sp.]|nr:TIGR02452 family protein [Succiniclasticum sp.]MEE3480037.1 TIGR02452 family protein [Succiniclasticum sp.]